MHHAVIAPDYPPAQSIDEFITAYKISRKKYKPMIAGIHAGIAGCIAVVVSGNLIAVFWNLGRFDISEIFENVIYIFWPWLPG